MEGFRELVSKTFFLDSSIDDRTARIAKVIGVGLTLLWLVLLIVHFVAYRKFGLLVLGMVTMVGWILLWRVAFLMMASYFRWKL